MANHCVISLPWKAEPEVAMLWALSCVRAAYGDAFEPAENFSKNDYIFENQKAYLEPTVWMSAPRSLELRRSLVGIEESTATFLHESMGRAFGALSACDEGIGVYPLPKPKPIDLDGPTWMGAMLERKNPSKNKKKPRYDGIYGENLRGIARNAFGPPGLIYWLDRLDWEDALDKRFGDNITPEQAASSAMAACSHGLKIPALALNAMTPEGATRALGVAFAWGNQAALESLRVRVPKSSGEWAADWARSKLKRVYRLCRDGSKESKESQAPRLAQVEALSQAWSIGYELSESNVKKRKTPRV